MQSILKWTLRVAGLGVFLSATVWVEATITGQWDFNNPANGLVATIGQPLEYLDGPNGETRNALAA